MLTTIISLYFCLTTISNAETIKLSPSPDSASFNITKELEKINSTCFTHRDHELLTGDNSKFYPAHMFTANLLHKSSFSIGLDELRRSLNFGPRGPWKRCKTTFISEEELASAPSNEEYHNMSEENLLYFLFSNELCLDDPYHFEKNIVIAIGYLDKRFPSIRTIYRHRFEEMHRLNNGLIDRQLIKRMTNELINIEDKIRKSSHYMLRSSNNCKDQFKQLFKKHL